MHKLKIVSKKKANYQRKNQKDLAKMTSYWGKNRKV